MPRINVSRFPHTRGDGPMAAAACAAIYSFPHTRGDGPMDSLPGLGALLFSPHPWGWTDYFPFATSRAIVFPTPVGMDRNLFPFVLGLNSFPHTRGDGPTAKATMRRCASVFPTPVGMDRYSPCFRAVRQCFPHTRGDGPMPVLRLSASDTFSPHPWGWTAGDRCDGFL